MENSPELDGKYLGTITIDFVKIASLLKEASYQLKARKISDFPIFPISKEASPIGQLLISSDERDLSWNIFFSFFEDFQAKGLIQQEKTKVFLENYKDPSEYCCLFVMDEEFNNFVYIPYPEEED